MDVQNPIAIAIDAAVLLSGGLVMQALKYLCRKRAYPSVATRVFSLCNEEIIFHFSKELWQLTWHSFCFVLELIVLIPSNFWPSIINPYNSSFGTSLFWDYNDEQTPPVGIRTLYLLQMGYYMTDMFHFCIEKRKDVYTMVVHHVATLCLLWMSYLPPNCWKIGSAILLVHEICDVTLYFCKSLHYAQYELLPNILFVFNILIWIWCRLVWFPRYIVSLWIDVEHKSEIWQIWPCSVLLSTLLVLHVYWVALMIKVLLKAVITKESINDPNGPGEVENVEIEPEEEDEDQVADLDDMEPLKVQDRSRTENLEDGGTPHPVKRRRSSLMEAFIESKENIVMSSDQTDHI